MIKTDKEILTICKKNKNKGLKLIYDKYSAILLGVCIRYVKRQEEAEDVLQNAFVKIFLNIDKLKDDTYLFYWLRKIVVNESINEYRKKKKMVLLSFDDSIKLDNHFSEDLDYDAKKIVKAINCLADGAREVFNLYAIEGYKHKEVAEILGIDESTSKSQYSRARTKIIKILKKKNK